MLKTLSLAVAGALMLSSGAAMAAPTVGEPAPAFTGVDTNGTEHSLSDFAGKTVVLEWYNDGCPYVQKHYGSGNMQSLQESAAADDVVWLTIVSSAEGKQGYKTPEEANALIEEEGSKATARILDPSGEIGQLYEAKTTPHMFVINPEGTLVYAGAIDSDSSFDPATIEGSTNYVTAALDSIKSGEPLEITTSTPYGCSVKY